MSEDTGEKTEQPTGKRLEEAVQQGNFARSAEIQTVVVLIAGMGALSFVGRETWQAMAQGLAGLLTHLHDIRVNAQDLQGYYVLFALFLARCAGPVVIAVALGALLAGGIQSRFQTSPEALEAKWERLNPVEGFKRIFNLKNALAPVGISLLKMVIILSLSYGEIRAVINDPIFFTSVNTARIAVFMAESAYRLVFRIASALIVVAALDYAWQWWKVHEGLMMTKEEVKEEMKNSDGNPQVKAALRKRGRQMSVRKMLAEVPKADVIVTNPTHLAIALRYDRKTMKAPRIIAKGARLNALRIREIAKAHGVPIIENKPLARMMFKYGRLGGEVPAQLYSAVAEVLAWVYRVNRYRYYAEQNQR